MTNLFKFHEHKPQSLEIGDIFPNITLGTGEYFNELVDDYILVILLSVYCKACISALEELSIFLEANESVNVLILADGPDEKIDYLRNEFPENVSIFKYTVQDMKERLKTGNTPWLYGVDRNGEVLKSYVCGKEYYELAYEGARESCFG